VIDQIEPESPPENHRSLLRLIVPLLVVVGLGALVAWWLQPPAARPAAPTLATAERAPAHAAPPSPAPAPAPAPRSTPRSVQPDEKPEAATLPPAPEALAKATLHVTSDVEGAHVFVDRQFVGQAPLDRLEVTAGHHQVHVSAEGYEVFSEAIDVAETGTTNLYASLKAVRLNSSVGVIHKHTLGSCEGTLHASLDGLSYETSNTSDAFEIRLADLENFTTDYSQKTLRLKNRAGKTWNFTTHAANADPLVSFEHEVNHARQRLGLVK
jgi:hypothetical protein